MNSYDSDSADRQAGIAGDVESHELSPDEKRALHKAAAASFVGNFVEWFDYASYSFLATVIAVVFFPAGHATAALLSSFAVFAVSFLMRPVGALFWGTVGDRRGRRWALSWSILLMTGATCLIGFLPSYAVAGLWAPGLLLILRMIQGFSASGEYAGAASFLSEYSPRDRRGMYTSLVPASTATGLLVGSLFVTLLHTILEPDAMTSWGWRIPFLLTGPLGWIGTYIRRHLEDSPVYRRMSDQTAAAQEKATVSNESGPISEIFTHHFGTFARGFGVACLNAVGFYMVLTYLPTYLTAELDWEESVALLASSLSLLVYIGSIFLMGHISDKFGRKRMLISACVLFIVLSVPLFSLLDNESYWLVIGVEIIFGLILAMNDGTLATFLVEIYPTRVRYTGFALSFNTANALFGGTAPFMATWLISMTGSKMAPAWYLVVVAILSLIAMLFSRETAFSKLKDH